MHEGAIIAHEYQHVLSYYHNPSFFGAIGGDNSAIDEGVSDALAIMYRHESTLSSTASDVMGVYVDEAAGSSGNLWRDTGIIRPFLEEEGQPYYQESHRPKCNRCRFFWS